MKMTTIVLADDHNLVRQGLRTLLETEPDFRVVGETGDGLEAVDLVRSLKPNVLVVDLMMPSLNGLEVTQRAKDSSPRTQIIILSMYSNEAYVLEALRNGAAGYVLKDSNADDLIKAVREAVIGRRYLSPPLSELAIEAYSQKSKATNIDIYETLTSREREVLHLAAEGHSNKEIATRLSISPRTAEVHRSNMMKKLGLHTKTDLVRYALNRGILPS